MTHQPVIVKSPNVRRIERDIVDRPTQSPLGGAELPGPGEPATESVELACGCARIGATKPLAVPTGLMAVVVAAIMVVLARRSAGTRGVLVAA
ncbi:MAG TPA: hypothetical protein VEO01_08265 [Pseudonocardiaceae bacterium]|nr:hypothetical protein [Pseudonocardiaceae bacterium]